MTTILQIADSVTAQLNAATLSQPVEAERLYVPNFDLEDMKELRVSVVPREVQFLPMDRGLSRYHGKIDIAVQKKFFQWRYRRDRSTGRPCGRDCRCVSDEATRFTGRRQMH